MARDIELAGTDTYDQAESFDKWDIDGEPPFDNLVSVEISQGVLELVLKSVHRRAEHDMAERAAQLAEQHGESIGENCWNHENREELAKTTCSKEIAEAIRALVGDVKP